MFTMISFCLLGSVRLAEAQGPAVHSLHEGVMPPGAIGRQRLLRGGPLSNYYQPTELRAPDGVRIGIANQGTFTEPEEGKPMVGLLLGQVYRFHVTHLVNHPGVELYPTVELIDRLYPPPGAKLKFPVPIELTEQELNLAAEGRFITRVIYVEDPMQALPIAQGKDQPYFEAGHGQDPLEVADRLGRPIAILRIGARRPPMNRANGRFHFGCPPLIPYGRNLTDGPVATPLEALPPPSAGDANAETNGG